MAQCIASVVWLYCSQLKRRIAVLQLPLTETRARLAMLATRKSRNMNGRCIIS